MKNESRVSSHQKNNTVETVLAELQHLLAPANTAALASLETTARPTVHLVGCARSGTTILHQLLVKHLDVCYPTNFLSRFYYAPYIGAKLQLLLNDLDNKKESLAAFPSFDLDSKLGKTIGPLAPHEFWYFWRSIFEVNELGWLKNVNLKTLELFYLGIDSVTSVFQKPMVLKSMIAQNRLAEFLAYRPQDKVVFLKRDTAFNAQSLLIARNEFFGDIEKWYSFVPENYQVAESPYQQVVEQVRFTNRMIENQLRNLDHNRVFEIDYETLGDRLPKLLDWLPAQLSIPFDIKADGLAMRNTIQIDSADFDRLIQFV